MIGPWRATPHLKVCGDECEGGKCILSQGDSGFCTRTCTSADDCPEPGWECNLAPYTACVPE